MLHSKFIDSQMMDALKRVGTGLVVPEVCGELDISAATFYKLRTEYGGMDTSMMACMNELDTENIHLKKVYIEENPAGQTSTSKYGVGHGINPN